MSGTYADPPDRDVAAHALDLGQRLDLARSRIEERFLEGSDVLVTALESTATLRAHLARVLAALDGDMVAATVSGITDTVRRLRELPGRQAAQQTRMAGLAESGTVLRTLLDDMGETLRYLRTVAVTVKIAGAEAGEFDELADTMLARIQAGRTRIDGFAARIGMLLGQASIASRLHRDLQQGHLRDLPALTRALEADATDMQEYHAALRRLAASQDSIAAEVEERVARTLSALQIGDMTRQRLEHVVAGLLSLGEVAALLAPDEQAVATGLLGHQLTDLARELHDESGAVSGNLAALAANMERMLALARQAEIAGVGDVPELEVAQAFLPGMERSILAAQAIVTRIESAARRADTVGDSAATIASELGTAVDAIATIRSDIQFMAINTSLRCRRLGEAGRAIVVVATELRNFAARLEGVSDRILTELARLETLITAESGSTSATSDAEAPLGEALDAALDTVRSSHREMQHNLQLLTARGEALAGDLGHAVARLDLTEGLGDTLDAAMRDLVAPDDNTSPRTATSPLMEGPGSAPLAALLVQIRAGYTMARERDLHDRLLPGTVTPTRADPSSKAQPRKATSNATKKNVTKEAEPEDDLAAILF